MNAWSVICVEWNNRNGDVIIRRMNVNVVKKNNYKSMPVQVPKNVEFYGSPTIYETTKIF